MVMVSSSVSTLLLTLLVSATPRRALSRHRESSSTTSSSQPTVTSREFSYSHKLNSTCLFSRSTELDSAVEMVRSDLADLRREMVFTDCYGASLTSLAASPGPDHISLHLSLTNILAHLFVMRMDWLLSTGLPCLLAEKEIRVRQLHNRLIQSWTNMNCVFLSSIHHSNSHRAAFQRNLNTVLDTPINTYSHCNQRRSRDCILLQQASSSLTLSQSYLARRTILVI